MPDSLRDSRHSRLVRAGAPAVSVGELSPKLETANPTTHSVKARGIAVASEWHGQLGLETQACSTTGALANAVASGAAAEGVEAVVFCGEWREVPPWELLGGAPGQRGRNALNGVELPAKAEFTAQPDDVLTIETPGGGLGAHEDDGSGG